MNRDDKSVDREMLLAEFAALRAEILQRMNMQWNMFALQLTAGGVVFSFALSNPSHTGFLLILPVVTYALAGRYVSQYLGTQRVGTYVREVLDVRAKGQLHWEEWNRVQLVGAQLSTIRTITWLSPLFLVFPGVAVIALIWVGPYVWTSHSTSVGERVLIIAIWLVGIAITALSFQLIRSIVPWHWSQTLRKRPVKPDAKTSQPSTARGGRIMRLKRQINIKSSSETQPPKPSG
jgi:hypothetical protein